MERPEGERIATLEQMLREAHEDRLEIKDEAARTRLRLHNLEGSVGMLLDAQRNARRAENSQYHRLELRLQVLTIVVAIAAVIAPLVFIIVSGK